VQGAVEKVGTTQVSPEDSKPCLTIV